MTTISVVIPTRNDADMLAVCLAALVGQPRPADEIVVVDNASTDNTTAVCTAAGARPIAVELPEFLPAPPTASMKPAGRYRVQAGGPAPAVRAGAKWGRDNPGWYAV